MNRNVDATRLTPTRVLIADDHSVVRDGLRALLLRDPELALVGEAVDGEDVCAQVARLAPDLVVMDVSMPRVNGLDAARRLSAAHPRPHIVALSVHDELAYVREMFRAGASGYVLKQSPSMELLRAVHAVITGGTYLDGALSVPGERPTAGTADLAVELTAREADVGVLAARGYSNAEMAEVLSISVKTVETHKTRVMAKLGLRTRAQLVRYAIHRGWLRR